MQLAEKAAVLAEFDALLRPTAAGAAPAMLHQFVLQGDDTAVQGLSFKQLASLARDFSHGGAFTQHRLASCGRRGR